MKGDEKTGKGNCRFNMVVRRSSTRGIVCEGRIYVGNISLRSVVVAVGVLGYVVVGKGVAVLLA